MFTNYTYCAKKKRRRLRQIMSDNLWMCPADGCDLEQSMLRWVEVELFCSVEGFREGTAGNQLTHSKG